MIDVGGGGEDVGGAEQAARRAQKKKKTKKTTPLPLEKGVALQAIAKTDAKAARLKRLGVSAQRGAAFAKLGSVSMKRKGDKPKWRAGGEQESMQF